jgi:hypothetical protein
MIARRYAWLLAAALLCGSPVHAQQDAATPQDAAPDPSSAAEPHPGDAPPAGNRSSDDAAPGAGAVDEEFVPSEEIQADEEVTFPVDI